MAIEEVFYGFLLFLKSSWIEISLIVIRADIGTVSTTGVFMLLAYYLHDPQPYLHLHMNTPMRQRTIVWLLLYQKT